MDCRGCGRSDAWSVKTVIDNGNFIDSCNFCGFVGSSEAYADVYFPRPHSCENITDDSGKPIHFDSRSQKARVMKERGITEAGDRISGARALPRPTGNSWYQMRRNAGKIK